MKAIWFTWGSELCLFILGIHSSCRGPLQTEGSRKKEKICREKSISEGEEKEKGISRKNG